MPGAFDNFEGTQEELDALIKEFERSVESGDLEKISEPVDLDKMKQEDPELANMLQEMFEKLEQGNNEDRNRKLN